MPVHLSFNMLHGQEMPVVCMVAMDLTEHKRLEEALRQLNVQLEKRVQDRTAELVKVNETLRAEIVERQRTEEALRESEARFRLALRNAPVSVAAQDRDLRYVWAYNQRTAEPDQSVGHFDHEIFTPEEAARMTAIKRRVLDEGIELCEQMWLDRPSGRIFLDICWEPIRDDAGRVTGVASATVDLTPIKLAEAQLRENDERLRVATESARAGMWSVHIPSNRWEFSPQAARLFGLRDDGPVTIEQVRAITHPDDRGRLAEQSAQALGAAGEHEIEYRVVQPDGAVRWLLLRGRTYLDTKERPWRNMGIIIDITERKRAEESLQQALAKAEDGDRLLTALMEHVPEGITIADGPDVKLRMVSRHGQELLGGSHAGLAAAEVVARWKIYHSDGVTPLAYADLPLLRALERGETVTNVELVQISVDGRRLPLLCNAAPLRAKTGAIVGAIAAWRDITERKRAEEALRKAYDELEVRVQERTSDLEEAIERLQVEILQRKRLEETLRESEKQVRLFATQCLTAQESERRRIAAELHDSLAASLAATKFRIETISQELKQGRGNPESMEDLVSNVGEIIKDVRRMMADLRPSILDDLGIIPAITWFCREFQQTYSHISVEKQIGLEEHYVPDPLKTPIFRIVQEAMNNVAKHSKASLVNLCLQREGDRILLSVQDNGQGFDPETVKKGMGLSNIRERAELSGGASELQSTMGKGTTVCVWWPIQVGNVA